MKNIYLYSLQNRPEKFGFLLVSKTCTKKLLIFQQCILVYIVYIFSVLVSLCSLAISEKISSYFSKSGAYLRWQSYWMSDSSELWHFIRTINISFWKLKIEMVQFFLIRILYNYCTWTRSIWVFMEQSTTILNEAKPTSILLYSAPLNLILIKFKCSNCFITYGSILL